MNTETTDLGNKNNALKNATNESSFRADALGWFFSKSEIEKEKLKDKYFDSEYVEYDSQWGFHFTFGQIEEMYVKDNNSKK